MDPVHDYPGYEPGRKRRPPWLGIALAVAVVIIVVLSAVVITQLKDDNSDTPIPAAPTIHNSSAFTTQQRPAATHERQPDHDLPGV